MGYTHGLHGSSSHPIRGISPSAAVGGCIIIIAACSIRTTPGFAVSRFMDDYLGKVMASKLMMVLHRDRRE